MLALDAAIIDRDRALREPDKPGDTLRQKALTAKEQLNKSLQTDFAANVESFYGMG